ncbi:hypothetical protein [uncultured Clostridium sp.]|uniref:hypothetical protein n=1 Tax=uncultured Clostridium sp. TaxID=59620 RepID=UPI00262646C6|nr:hypothetical protein [uncultured Clostridium sp.]
MKVLTHKDFNESSLNTHILSVINKAKKLLIFYFCIIIITSIILLISIIPSESINIAIAILDFIALLLLYDSLKYILSLSKALKDPKLLITFKGILTSKDKRGDTFYIKDNKLPKLQALDKSELRKFINQNIEIYMVEKKLLFIIT